MTNHLPTRTASPIRRRRPNRLLSLGVLCVALGSLPAICQPQTRVTPGPEHKKLEIFAGKWRYEETTFNSPFGQASRGSGSGEARLILDGLVLQDFGKASYDTGTYEWLTLITYDRETGQYHYATYDTDGLYPNPARHEHLGSTIQGNTWSNRWKQRTGNRMYHCRSVLVFAPDQKSYTYEWSWSEDGNTWSPMLKGVATRTSKARRR